MSAVSIRKYPKNWAEMSFDFKLLFVFHGSMMVLLFVGSAVPLGALIGVVGILLIVLAVLSVLHRKKSGWRWPGVGLKGILGSAFSVAVCLFFFGAATPQTSPLKAELFPWLAAGGGILIFLVLSNFRVVFQTESEFLRHCGDPRLRKPGEARARSTEKLLKAAVRAAFYACFFAVWATGVSLFWSFNRAFQNGTPEPNADRVEVLKNHGKTVYVTPEEERFVSLLEGAVMIGVPSVLLLGGVIHFVVGIKLFPNVPTLAEQGRRKEEKRN